MPYFASLTDIAARIATGDIASVALTEAQLARIDALDGDLKAYATVTAEQALTDARRADADRAAGRCLGPLHGVPIAVKDLCFTKGVRTMGGTGALADHMPNHDATVVTRLREAGAVILGKLNLTEGAMGGYHPNLRIPVNPWDPGVWTGSSSSGSGVATAVGTAYGTLGSDTGGSIRFPASACGVVGLKPTWGRVSRHGVLALADSLDHVGPITRTVADAALMFSVIAGADANDPTSIPTPVADVLTSIAAGVKGLRIGVDENEIRSNADPQVAEAVLTAIRHLEQLGAHIVAVNVPDVTDFVAAWPVLCQTEAVVAHAATYPSRRNDYGPWFRDWLDAGARHTAVDYARAHHLRLACNGLFRSVFETDSGIDILACPSMPNPPHAVSPDVLYGPMGAFAGAKQRYTVPFDYNGYPTLSLPCGFTTGERPLPLSLQLVSRPLDEATLCRAGHAYEKSTEWHTRHPDV